MSLPRRVLLVGVGDVVALVAVVGVLFALDDGDGFTLAATSPGCDSS